jgi:hypothetical protein
MSVHRSTLYNGIQMRSRLEADFAGWLDGPNRPAWCSGEWAYEPQCFASEQGRYLPDFSITGRGGRHAYIEVKPVSFPDDDIDPLLERMQIIWQSEPDASLILVFWEFGASQLGTWLFTIGDPRWWSIVHEGASTSWPGLGQLEACIDAAAARTAGEQP